MRRLTLFESNIKEANNMKTDLYYGIARDENNGEVLIFIDIDRIIIRLGEIEDNEVVETVKCGFNNFLDHVCNITEEGIKNHICLDNDNIYEDSVGNEMYRMTIEI